MKDFDDPYHAIPMLGGDYKGAKSLAELEGLIDRLSKRIASLSDTNSPIKMPDILIEPYQERLNEVTAYYRKFVNPK